MPPISRRDFVEAYSGRSVALEELQKPLSEPAAAADANGDGKLSGKAELEALFDRVEDAFDQDGKGGVLTTRDGNGTMTEVGHQYGALTSHFEGKAPHGIDSKDDFFAGDALYDVQIDGWHKDRMTPGSLAEEVEDDDAEVLIYRAGDHAQRLLPGAGSEKDLVFRAVGTELRTSGNLTNGTPKSSLKVKFSNDDASVFGMESLNLKSMWNDVSQMREALAWELFEKAGVHAPRHAFGRATMNDKYAGLYSIIEQVDDAFLKDHFGENSKGNLYKAYWPEADVGPATLEYRKGKDGDDSGKQYFKQADGDARTYQLKTNDSDDKANGYDDLATFVRTLNGVGLPGTGDEKFNTPEYKKAIESVFDVKGFLRWASTNMLLGAWDNYWATPANYYLYNSGKAGKADEFVDDPYFHWIPWDYDNTFGIDYFKTDWQYADIDDWGASTKGYNKGKGKSETKLPLIENLLKNDEFKQYYLDHMEWQLDTQFNPDVVAKKIGTEGGNGLWEKVRHSAFAEADGPTHGAHTGRQWTNDQVYWNGYQQHELQVGDTKLQGISHYVRMRHDSAKAQLAELRKEFPKGASGAKFPEEASAVPK